MRSRNGLGVACSAAAGQSCAASRGASPGVLSRVGGVSWPGADAKSEPKRPPIDVMELIADTLQEGSSTELLSGKTRPNRFLTPVAAAVAAAAARPVIAGGAPPLLEPWELGSAGSAAAAPAAEPLRTGLALVVPAKQACACATSAEAAMFAN
jgi:hypothetical protein